MTDPTPLVPVSQDIVLQQAPEHVINEAGRAAKLLMEVVANKPDPVVFNGKRYLEVDDWQTLGRMYGLTAKVTETESVEHNGATGFLARAIVLRGDGAEISAGEAMCLNDEENWSTRPKFRWMNTEHVPAGAEVVYEEHGRSKVKVGEVPVPAFQLRGMAQTRAIGRALRHVLGYVAVLAGFSATVAEEMTGDETEAQQDSRVKVQTPQAKAKSAPPKANPANGHQTTGNVTTVTSKAGTNSRGDYTKWSVQLDGSQWFSSFNDDHGHVAQEAAARGVPVTLTYEVNGQFKNIVAIAIDESESAGVPD